MNNYMVYIDAREEPGFTKKFRFTYKLWEIANWLWSLGAGIMLIGALIIAIKSDTLFIFRILTLISVGGVSCAVIFYSIAEGTFVLAATDDGLVFKGRGLSERYCLIPWKYIKKIDYNVISIVDRGNTGTQTDLFFKRGTGTLEVTTSIPQNRKIELKPCNGGRVAIDGYWVLSFGTGAVQVMTSTKSKLREFARRGGGLAGPQ